MKGWWPSPSGQVSDPRCAALSLNGRGLWWSLCDAADGRGAVPLGAMTLDAVLLALSGRTPEAQVRAAWQELYGVHLAYVEGGVIALDLPEPDVSQSETFAEPQGVAGEVTTRPDKAGAVKRLRALLSKLALKTAEARAAWLESEHGGKTLERLGLTTEDGRAVAETTGRRGRPVRAKELQPVTFKTVTGDEEKVTEKVTTVSPAPPSGEKDTEKEAAESARAGMVTEKVTGPCGMVTEKVTRLPSVESTVVRVTAAEVLFHLRTTGGLRLSAGATQERELDGVLASVTPAWTLAGVQRLAAHIKAGHLRDGWRPKIDDFRGKDGSYSRLLTLHDEAQECPRCATARPVTPVRKVTPPQGMRPPSMEEIAAFERVARGGGS